MINIRYVFLLVITATEFQSLILKHFSRSLHTGSTQGTQRELILYDRDRDGGYSPKREWGGSSSSRGGGGGRSGRGGYGGRSGGRGGYQQRMDTSAKLRFSKTIQIDPNSKKLVTDMDFSARTLKVLKDKGFEYMTPVQSQSYEYVASGEDVVARSRTGTGKTFAFGLPLIEKLIANGENELRGDSNLPLILVLEPTRELAVQVAEELQSVCSAHRMKVLAVYGGSSFLMQERALKSGVHILVATPGRALDHISRGTVKLGSVKHVVLDEGDTMLEMGFQKDVESIIMNVRTPGERARRLAQKALEDTFDELAGGGSAGPPDRYGRAASKLAWGEEEGEAKRSRNRVNGEFDADEDDDYEADDELSDEDAEIGDDNEDEEAYDEDAISYQDQLFGSKKSAIKEKPEAQQERHVQMLLFSATMPGWICSLTDKHMINPVFLDAVQEGENRLATTIEHVAIKLPSSYDRIAAVTTFVEDIILTKGGGGQTIVFTNTRDEANQLLASECFGQLKTQVIHGDIGQGSRQATLKQFKDGQLEVLVATDVAARGLDIAGVDLVVHISPPPDEDTYVHRSGRTGEYMHTLAVYVRICISAHISLW